MPTIEDDDFVEGRYRLGLFADPLAKAGYSGAAPVYTRLERDGPKRLDAELWTEGEPFEPGGGRLLPYLRTVILQGGGIGPGGIEHADPALLRRLTAGLVPF